MKKKLKFLLVFFIIGVESLGNMSAVMAILEENLVKRNSWVTEDDIINAVALARLGPGATTANAVAYLGNKIAGILGGFIATICYVIGPLIIIACCYTFLDKLLEYKFISSAFKGCLIYICVLFITSTFDMGKKVLKCRQNTMFFVLALIVSLFSNCPYILIILLCVVCALLLNFKSNKSYK